MEVLFAILVMIGIPFLITQVYQWEEGSKLNKEISTLCADSHNWNTEVCKKRDSKAERELKELKQQYKLDRIEQGRAE